MSVVRKPKAPSSPACTEYRSAVGDGQSTQLATAEVSDKLSCFALQMSLQPDIASHDVNPATAAAAAANDDDSSIYALMCKHDFFLDTDQDQDI